MIMWPFRSMLRGRTPPISGEESSRERDSAGQRGCAGYARGTARASAWLEQARWALCERASQRSNGDGPAGRDENFAHLSEPLGALTIDPGPFSVLWRMWRWVRLRLCPQWVQTIVPVKPQFGWEVSRVPNSEAECWLTYTVGAGVNWYAPPAPAFSMAKCIRISNIYFLWSSS